MLIGWNWYDELDSTLATMLTALGPGEYGVIVIVSVDVTQLTTTKVKDYVLVTEYAPFLVTFAVNVMV